MYPLRRTERINRGRAWHALARRPPPPARAPAQPQVPLPFPSHSSPQKIPKEITLASEGGGAARLRAPRREAFQRCSLRRGCAPPPAFVSAAFLLPPRGLQNRPREEHAFGGQFRCAGGEGREDADPEDPEGPGQEEGQGRARRAARGGRGGARCSPACSLAKGEHSHTPARPPQEVKKEEKSGSGQSPTQGTPKKDDSTKAGKGSKCHCPGVVGEPAGRGVGGVRPALCRTPAGPGPGAGRAAEAARAPWLLSAPQR